MGKRMKDVYPYATRFQVIKWKIRMFFRKLFIVSIAIVSLVGALFIGKTFYPNTTYAVQEKLVMVDSLDRKIDELKNNLIDDLVSCESAGHKEDDGIIIFDSNNKASIGQLQFQITTVQHYMKVIHGETITRKEAVLIALDEKKARALAGEIIFGGDSKGLGNWFNCTNKKDLDTQLSIIKKLQK